MKPNIKKGLIAIAVPVAMVLATAAEAVFLPAFEGFSVFGADPSQCAKCDSTVSFAVWQNTDGDWRDDLPAATALGSASDGTEQYVYLYQVVNTDPLPALVGILDTFNVTYGGQGGSLTPNPFLAGGFFGNTAFDNVSSAVTPLDFLNTGSPSSVSTVTLFQTVTGLFAPASLTTDLITNNDITGSYPAIQFLWSDNDEIPVDGASPVLFLTSNLAPTYRWAETESPPSPGPPGAGGDVPSVVPVPAAVWLFGSGLLGLLGLARRKMTA